MLHIIYHEGNANQNNNTTMHLSGWPGAEPWQYQMFTKMWISFIRDTLLVGMHNGTAMMEDSLTVSYKSKQILIIQSSNHTWYLPKGVESACPQKNTCTWMVIAGLLITDQTWKQPRCPSISEWVNSSRSRQWNISQC